MIRFVDLTRDYFCFGELSDPSSLSPTCAFANTITSKFIHDDGGEQIFFSQEDVADIEKPLNERCLSLIPEGFFDLQSDYWKEKANSA